GYLQQLHCRQLEFPQRQRAVPVRGRLQQDVVNARPRSVYRVSRNPDLLCNLVGGRETDPVDVLRQRVRVLTHLFDCLLSVGLEDSHRPAGTDAVAMQEEHDLADLLYLLPRVRYPLPALGTDPVYRLEFCGSVLDYG